MQLIKVFILACFCTIAIVAPPQVVLAQSTEHAASTAPDYEAWRSFATRAENVIDDGTPTEEVLEELRQELVAFRSAFLAAQDANQSRIASLREQISALGAAPEEGVSEAPEIAARRVELHEQLAALQAPGIAAQEAFRRADGMIRQIDVLLRERQAEALLELWPSPINPVNWVDAADAVWDRGFTFYTQVANALTDPARLREFRSNLPIVLLLFAFAGFVLLRGRLWIERAVSRLLHEGGAHKSRRVFAEVASLAQIIVPVTAVIAVAVALDLTGIIGDIGSDLTNALIGFGIIYFAARWAGGEIFPAVDTPQMPLKLPETRRREGRFLSHLMGLIFGLSLMLMAFIDPDQQSDTANAVILFPVLVLAGIVLMRFGSLMTLHTKLCADQGDERRFYDRMINILGRGAVVIGAGAPVFAAIGYVQAAEAVLFPAVMSLWLVAVLIFIAQLVSDFHDMVTGRNPDDPDALIPALISFGLVVLSLPVFALVWGVRLTELLEMWQVLREGFRIGDTRISPTNILSFVIIFSIGYMLTRMVQGALGSSVLPKTRIDKGGQKAIISGTGYIGIFIAGLVAISTAGIDLSGLAIVAGALSVGIGFGLQNIVSNFISGLILLIERPVAEGDWIEVGSTMGTVRSISVRSTIIETFDRTDVIVPNADLISGTVTNWTRFSQTGRVIIPVGVAYGSDTRKVERILKEIGDAQPLALLDPSPAVHFTDFGADALEFELRIVISDVGLGLAVRTEVRHQIAERFQQEGIEIPFAQRDIWLRNPEVLRGDTPAPATPDAEPEAAQPKAMQHDEITEGDAGGDTDPDGPDGR
ncbi:DUF3772 domain-containing protein [Roseinatronobacter alkalisoli]|uniref:DUF3772 domain-containing protein n=1 Tax=Roseinatronobacter alkalisoli TaxID=3028235 RepID=A0ABT5T7P5_9RHOB|nr:DUF3772 domain-containing protein [Roseinatronobacter sp. HJB301]MDD7971137.1 DUF3772 domain-containing protein [Roseinatronobacter sp. HJB301]